MKAWVKLYTEVLDDPKLGRLSWADRGIWTSLLALAGRLELRDGDNQETGEIGTLDDICWYLRCQNGELSEALSRFSELNMVLQDGGVWYVVHWAQRQARYPSAQPDATRQRQQKHRTPVTTTTPPPVTSPSRVVTSLDKKDKRRIDAEKTQLVTDSLPLVTEPATAAAFTAWQSARGGAINEMDSFAIGELCDQFTAEWVTAAIKEANSARQDKLPSLNFLRAILDRWKREGFKAPFDAKANREKALTKEQDQEEAEKLQRKLERWERQHGIRQ